MFKPDKTYQYALNIKIGIYEKWPVVCITPEMKNKNTSVNMKYVNNQYTEQLLVIMGQC